MINSNYNMKPLNHQIHQPVMDMARHPVDHLDLHGQAWTLVAAWHCRLRTLDENGGSPFFGSVADVAWGEEPPTAPLVMSNNLRLNMVIQCGAPKIAKLVYNSNNYGLWYL